MSKKQYKIIFISIIAAVALFLVFSKLPQTAPEKINVSAAANISVSVVAGSSTLNLTLPAGHSLYDALLAAKENKQIAFVGKNYPGLGFFITDIGSLRSGNGKNLIYYINDKEASVGVSSYIPQNGDVILWKLE